MNALIKTKEDLPLYTVIENTLYIAAEEKEDK
jgi:hypothetical protein